MIMTTKTKIEYDQATIDQIRKHTMDEMARQILSVQPMDPKIFINMLDAAMSEEELVKNGYEPVDSVTKLMWRKKT